MTIVKNYIFGFGTTRGEKWAEERVVLFRLRNDHNWEMKAEVLAPSHFGLDTSDAAKREAFYVTHRKKPIGGTRHGRPADPADY